MRLSDRAERIGLNEAGLKVRMVGQQLKSEGMNPDAPITRDVFLATMDMLKDELGKLSLRIEMLEKRIDATAGAMRYAGEWLRGFEYSPGDLVEFEAAVFVAVQPRELDQPPSRFTGWAKLPMEA